MEILELLLVVVVVLGVCAGIIFLQRANAKLVNGVPVVTYPPTLWAIALFALAPVFDRLVANPGSLRGPLIVLALLGLYLLAEALLTAHRLLPEGFERITPGRPRRLLRWEELESVEYQPSMTWFRLRTRQGDTAYLSLLMNGLGTFADQLLAHAPNAVTNEATRTQLSNASKRAARQRERAAAR